MVHCQAVLCFAARRSKTSLPPCAVFAALWFQDAFEWGSSKVVMDVGGGRGELLSTVMSWAGQDCKGLLLDVQMVIDR